MKKFIIPIIANIIAFVCVPIACTFLDSETLKEIWVLILVVGNSAYFFVQSNAFARKHKELVPLFIINIVTMILYMYIYLSNVNITFILFYCVMMMLGMRDGDNRRKYKEQLQKLVENAEDLEKTEQTLDNNE